MKEDNATVEVKTMEEKVHELLNSFVNQELGNKITQFNMQGFAMALMQIIKEK